MLNVFKCLPINGHSMNKRVTEINFNLTKSRKRK